MKEFKGTPKPWRFDDLEFKIKGTGDIDNLTVIANVSPKMDFSRGKTTQFYNAMVMVAAPELLEALKIMVKNGYQCPSNKDLEYSKSVINKALGL